MKFPLFVLLVFIPLFSFSQKYQKYHFGAFLVDTHNDVPTAVIEKGLKFDSDLSGKTHSDLNRMIKGGVDAQMFSIWCSGEQQNSYAWANREIDSVHAWVNRNPEKMMMVYTPADLKKAFKQKKLATMMGVEGGHMLENDLTKLEELYKRGVRYMTLTWNNSTEWATSAMDEASPNPSKGGAYKDSAKQKGLTDFGKQVVKRMNDLGMMVDLSHVGEQTFLDAIHTTTKPVIVSHSCVHALCPVFRNLKDEQIIAIKKNGGVIHLNFFSGFVDSTFMNKQKMFFEKHKAEIDSIKQKNPEANREYVQFAMFEKYKDEVEGWRPPLSMLLDHLDYIVKLIGVDHVGIGSDFDGVNSTPQGLNSVEDYPLITKALVERGYSKKEIYKILGRNFIRVFVANGPQ